MSNWPLKGGKAELWEGGVRGAAFLYGNYLPSSVAGQRSPVLCHATDWYRTFAGLAGVSLDAPRSAGAALYGVDIWSALVQGREAGPFEARDEVLHNVDPVSGQQALRLRDYKLLRNVPPSAWGPDPRTDATPTVSGGPALFWSPAHAEVGGGGSSGGAGGLSAESARKWPDRLYKITADPNEATDLASDADYADILWTMQSRLEELQGLGVPLRRVTPDAIARPLPVPGLQLCTPSPVGPILCAERIGVWQPWQPDPVTAGGGETARRCGHSTHGDREGRKASVAQIGLNRSGWAAAEAAKAAAAREVAREAGEAARQAAQEAGDALIEGSVWLEATAEYEAWQHRYSIAALTAVALASTALALLAAAEARRWVRRDSHLKVTHPYTCTVSVYTPHAHCKVTGPTPTVL